MITLRIDQAVRSGSEFSITFAGGHGIRFTSREQMMDWIQANEPKREALLALALRRALAADPTGATIATVLDGKTLTLDMNAAQFLRIT